MGYSIYYTRLMMGLVALLCQWDLTSSLLYAQQSDSPLPHLELPARQTIVINMESYSFTPSEVVVEAGNPVMLSLTNQSFLVPHNFLLDDPDGVRLVDMDVPSGETKVVPLTLTDPGIYPFYCDKKLLFFPSHREQGMEGRLIVR